MSRGEGGSLLLPAAQPQETALMAALYAQLVQAQRTAAEAVQEAVQLRSERDALRAALTRSGHGAQQDALSMRVAHALQAAEVNVTESSAYSS